METPPVSPVAGRSSRAASGILLCAALLAAPPLVAQVGVEAPEGNRVSVAIHTEDVYAGFVPRAVVHLEQPAYLAVFEVEPDVGAVRLFPYAARRPGRLGAGTHAFRLSGPRAAHLRGQLLWRLEPRLRARGGLRPHAHLVAVASRRPLRFDRLRGGRVFVYRPDAGFAARGTPTEVASALLSEILADPAAGGWDHDLHAYPKGRSPALASLFGAGPGALADAAALGCFLPAGPDPLFLAISATPISAGACRTLAHEIGRLAVGYRSVPGWRPFFAGTVDPAPPAGEPGESPTRTEGAASPGRTSLQDVADARSAGVSAEALARVARAEGLPGFRPATRAERPGRIGDRASRRRPVRFGPRSGGPGSVNTLWSGPPGWRDRGAAFGAGRRDGIPGGFRRGAAVPPSGAGAGIRSGGVGRRPGGIPRAGRPAPPRGGKRPGS